MTITEAVGNYPKYIIQLPNNLTASHFQEWVDELVEKARNNRLVFVGSADIKVSKLTAIGASEIDLGQFVYEMLQEKLEAEKKR